VAAGLRNVVYTLAPERIVVGGGVAQLPGLVSRAREHLRELIGSYPGLPEHADDGFVVPAALGERAGPVGALVLAEHAGRGSPATSPCRDRTP
jgi:fructokinase